MTDFHNAGIDLTVFKELQDTAGAEFTAELVATFLDEAPLLLEQLTSALAAKQADAFRRTAHSLKSNALTFGAINLAAMARELEQQFQSDREHCHPILLAEWEERSLSRVFVENVCRLFAPLV